MSSCDTHTLIVGFVISRFNNHVFRSHATLVPFKCVSSAGSGYPLYMHRIAM